MTRDEAIRLIAQSEVQEMNFEERESILLDWWSIGPDDLIYDILSEPLRRKLKRLDSPDNPADSIYDELLTAAMSTRYMGVLNSYLESQLMKLGLPDIQLNETPEEMSQCPCCGYHSLPSAGDYCICPVCFWEDDGTNIAGGYSHANHMTLAQGRENFRRYGVCNISNVVHVDPESRLKYRRPEPSKTNDP